MPLNRNRSDTRRARVKRGTVPKNLRGVKVIAHPQFGAKPHKSEYVISEAELLHDFLELETDYATIFPQSAIPADAEKQNRKGYSSREWYVDELKKCIDCAQYFIFFAVEQKYWAEDLHYFVRATAVRCPQCRLEDREVRDASKRYGDLVGRNELQDDELKELIEATIVLCREGAFRHSQKVYTVRKMARERFPRLKATSQLEAAINECMN